MNIDMANFTPLASLLGGVLIGGAAWLLIIGAGRIAGISGIIGGLLKPRLSDKAWRLAFVLGLMGAPWLYQLFAPLPASTQVASWPVLVLAGVLVGVGTRYGAGCTSGHGVCGLSRLSLRSLVATLTFMATGFITVWLVG
ncbi:MAG: YeeE/YedE family protein [Aeromonas sp.]